MPNEDSRSSIAAADGLSGASQFVPPVHAVKVSTNGLVSVADRGGRRVQNLSFCPSQQGPGLD